MDTETNINNISEINIFTLNWYILKRDKEYMIVCTSSGCDPLYRYNSWNLHSGPFSTYEKAENEIPKEISEFVVDS